ncbi:MAG TPA: hypothetical protein VKM55_21115 [Candidatus Lokiarchaeia archaeon]|nr:hypothetical protein [Candidatus Lokiarchaeia archaeon]
MVEFILIPPDQKWDKKVIKLANEYNDLVRKWQLKNDKKAEEKIRDFIIKIEDSMIKETNDKIKKDHAFMIQLIEERHQGMDLFTPEALVLEEHMLGRGTSDEELTFKEMGSTETAPTSQQPFDIQSIDLTKIDLLNLEKITPDDLEKSDQKCAYGDGEILDEHGNVDGEIWRCKGCKTVYHENCLRVCLLMKGSCQICDVNFLPRK